MSPHCSRAMVLLAFCLAGPACTDAGAAVACAQARATFETFQDALRKGDEATVRRLLTAESQEVVAHLPWERIRTQRPLEAMSIEQHDFEFWIRIRDPNDDFAESTFVVVREHGSYVVDLVATAGHHTAILPKDGPHEFEDRPLTPGEIAEIRAKAAGAVR